MNFFNFIVGFLDDVYYVYVYKWCIHDVYCICAYKHVSLAYKISSHKIDTTVIVTINNIVFAYVFKSHHKVVLKPSLHCQALIQGLYIGLHDSEIEVRVTASHIGLTNLVLEHIQCVTWLKKNNCYYFFHFCLLAEIVGNVQELA